MCKRLISAFIIGGWNFIVFMPDIETEKDWIKNSKTPFHNRPTIILDSNLYVRFSKNFGAGILSMRWASSGACSLTVCCPYFNFVDMRFAPISWVNLSKLQYSLLDALLSILNFILRKF